MFTRPASRLNTVRLRSHLASPLRPGRGVLIRSVSRRLGSVAYVREDASPNEVSSSTTVEDARFPAHMSIRPAQLDDDGHFWQYRRKVSMITKDGGAAARASAAGAELDRLDDEQQDRDSQVRPQHRNR